MLLVSTLLLILALLAVSMISLAGTEKLTAKGSFQATQAYYVADGAMERVVRIIKVNPGVLKHFNLTTGYGKNQLETLASGLAGPDLESVQQLIGLFGSGYTPVDDVQNPTGTIVSVNLTRIDQDSNQSRVCIETTGQYGPAKRSLIANLDISMPLNEFQGILVQNTPSFYNHAVIKAPLTVLSGMDFDADSSFYENIFIQGDCIVGPNATFSDLDEMTVYGNTSLQQGAQFEGELKSAGHVIIEGNVLGGPVRSNGDVTVGAGHVGRQAVTGEGAVQWDGDIYAAGSITPPSSDSFGTAYPNTPQTITGQFPELPRVDGLWYAQNCDHKYTGDQSFSAEDLAAGIHYVEGDVTISGTYQGNITVVATGDITVSNNAALVARNLEQDSLFLLAMGDIYINGDARVEALVYSPQTVLLAEGAELKGSVITKNLDCGGAKIVYEPAINRTHPPWITTNITILSWQEKYAVIQVN